MSSFFRGAKRGFSVFGHNLSLIVNSVLLTPVYFVGVGLTSVFAKLAKKHFLITGKEKKTYWSELNLKKRPVDEYYRQF